MQQFFRPSLLLILSLIPTTTSFNNFSIPNLLSQNGCGVFADLLISSTAAADSFAFNIAGGITAFVPRDPAVKPFLPKFKNLTGDCQVSLLLYHAVPIYYSVSMLKSGNGVVNTLATDGGTAKDFNFTIQNDGDYVTLRSGVATARITGTIFDADPVALYSIDRVMEPPELFQAVVATSPAAADDSPRAAGKKQRSESPAAASPGGKAADQKAVDDSGAGPAGKPIVAATVAIFFALVLFWEG